MLEKGGVWDKWNRFTQKWEKRFIFGGGAVWLITGAPIAAWVTTEATKWFIFDWGSEKVINKGAEMMGIRKKDGAAKSYSLKLNSGLPSNASIETKSNNILPFPIPGKSQQNIEPIPISKYQPREVQMAA